MEYFFTKIIQARLRDCEDVSDIEIVVSEMKGVIEDLYQEEVDSRGVEQC